MQSQKLLIHLGLLRSPLIYATDTDIYRVGKKSVKTLKNYKTRKVKQNKKWFADLASISHGIFFKIRKKYNSKNSRQMALIQTI